MEDTLGVFLSVATQPIFSVLILVLMEDTLGGAKKFARVLRLSSLNPCSNGRYSRSANIKKRGREQQVLILVLMEDTLGGLGA